MTNKNNMLSLWIEGWDKSDPFWLFKFAGFFGAGPMGMYGAWLIYNGEHNVVKAMIIAVVALFVFITPIAGVIKSRSGPS